MNTTDIFIEHLIAGVQVGVWLLLLFLSVFGYEWVNIEQIQQMQLILAVILLPFIYPLGIVVDNIADEILQPLHRRIRKSVVPPSRPPSSRYVSVPTPSLRLPSPLGDEKEDPQDKRASPERAPSPSSTDRLFAFSPP